MVDNRIAAKRLVLKMVSSIFLLMLFFAELVFAVDLRDPTTPLYQVPRAEAQVDLVLTAIADVGSRRFAIVNDRRVYPGDQVNGAIIEQINEGNIVYSHKGKKYTLNMRLSIID